MNRGFTLIELAIVLVVIALIIGGILVGADLVSAAAARAQIAQIEKYNSAAHTFQAKYGYLPGDIADPAASQFGFSARGTDCSGGPCAGEGNGDGLLQAYDSAAGVTGTKNQSVNYGETAMFWVDLSVAGLIDTNLNAGTIDWAGYGSDLTHPARFMPAARIGVGNYIYTWSGGYNQNDNNNYYAIAVVTQTMSVASGGSPYAGAGITVAQALSIDTKIDDGLPQYGKVLAVIPAPGTYGVPIVWAAGGMANGWNGSGGPQGDGSSWGDNSVGSGSYGGPHLANEWNTPSTAYTCYYEVNGMEVYDIKHNASALNCALSIQMQ